MWLVLQIHYLMPDQSEGSRHEANSVYIRLRKISDAEMKEHSREYHPDAQ